MRYSPFTFAVSSVAHGQTGAASIIRLLRTAEGSDRYILRFPLSAEGVSDKFLLIHNDRIMLNHTHLTVYLFYLHLLFRKQQSVNA